MHTYPTEWHGHVSRRLALYSGGVRFRP